MRPITWEIDLVDWANRMRGKPFVWGETDCASLGRQMVLLLTETDPAPEVTYHDLRSAQTYLKAHSLAMWLDRAGAVVVPEGYAFAQSGDILVGKDRDHPGMPGCAFAAGGKWVVVSVEQGVQIGLPLESLSDTTLYRLPFPIEVPADE